MVSINTSTASNAFALSNLRTINASIETTQNRISSGLKVASAADDASIWATAQNLRTDEASQEALQGGMSMMVSALDTGLSALDTVSDLITTIQGKITFAQTPGADKTSINNEIAALRTQIDSVIVRASFNGVNVIDGGTGLPADADTVTAGYQVNVATDVNDGTVTNQVLTIVDMDDAANKIGTAKAIALSTSTDYAALATAYSNAQKEVVSYSTTLSGFKNLLNTQTDFLDKLSGIRQTAIGSLVDADMEKESARISALQVRQQLAYQVLSMTSNSAQNILRLFQ